MTVQAPTECGLYLAYRGRGGVKGRKRTWTLVVNVYGEYPFFKIDVWDFDGKNQKNDIDAREITLWGPRIDLEVK